MRISRTVEVKQAPRAVWARLEDFDTWPKWATPFGKPRRITNGRWVLLGEVPRRPGLTARAARSMAIVEATGGTAKRGQTYAAVLGSEWRLAQDWTPPKP